MRKLYCGPIANLPKGCVVESDVVTERGVLLIPLMTTIDDGLHEVLSKHHEIIYTHIIIDSEEDIVVKSDAQKDADVEPDNTLSFDDSFKDYAIKSLTAIYNNIEHPAEIVVHVNRISDELCKYVNSSADLGININNLRVSDEYTYKHSIEVGTLSAVIAAEMGKPEQFIHDVAIAGVLHDLGKEKIPLDILNKPSKLTDAEFMVMKKHPIFSYQIMRDAKDIPEEIRQAMLNHHENVDGTGYPRGLKGDEITDMGKILAIADVFDALTTERPYKKAKTPAQAIEIMFTMSNKFDLVIFKKFLGLINAYPNGSVINLSNGTSAVVVRQNKSYPLRPVVKIIGTNEVVDLSSNMNYLSIIVNN